jgi:hypothetical protein
LKYERPQFLGSPSQQTWICSISQPKRRGQFPDAAQIQSDD